MNNFKIDHGVRIVRPLSQRIEIPQDKYIIVEIDNKEIKNIDDVKKIMNNKSKNENTKITFRNQNGQQESYTFRN